MGLGCERHQASAWFKNGRTIAGSLLIEGQGLDVGIGAQEEEAARTKGGRRMGSSTTE